MPAPSTARRSCRSERPTGSSLGLHLCAYAYLISFWVLQHFEVPSSQTIALLLWSDKGQKEALEHKLKFMRKGRWRKSKKGRGPTAFRSLSWAPANLAWQSFAVWPNKLDGFWDKS